MLDQLHQKMTPEELEALTARLNAALCMNKYMGGKKPTVPQAAFMLAQEMEVLFGGSAGPGKSTGQMFCALQYVHVPGYNALMVRRTFQQLSKPGGLLSKAEEWLRPTNAAWNGENRTWKFPSGATLSFGHLENPGTGPDNTGDETAFQGAEFQAIFPDELTQLPTSWPYLYLMSRLRRLKDSPIPVRMRPASNPGGLGHDWVYERFIAPGSLAQGRRFIPVKMTDNPYLDQETYRKSLEQLDPVTRAQLLDGNWTVKPAGDLFKTRHIRAVQRPTGGILGWVRYWDKAGTGAGEKGAKTAKYTVGLLMARVVKAMYGVEYVVVDVVRGQWSAGERDKVIKVTASRDPFGTEQWIEQEPGSGGKQSAEITVSDLAGYIVKVERPTGDKLTRARPVASQIEYWNVGMVQAPWNKAFIDELTPAPNGLYWDQIDTLSGAFNRLRLLVVAAPPVFTPGRQIGAGVR